MNNDKLRKLILDGMKKAVAFYWKTRDVQRKKQEGRGRIDQGLRSAVTGGAQMDGFIDLFTEFVIRAGIPKNCIFRKRAVELPGFYRPTKEWDMIIVHEQKLIAAIEAKSQVGPSFGNNFNNRVEEAIGSTQDLWTAFREKAYLDSPKPFLGYVFFCLKTAKPQIAQLEFKNLILKFFPNFEMHHI